MADLSDNTNWFETDASNNKAPPNGWPEGMMPSGVNDTARGDKGALKRFWDRINPVQVVTPSSGVYTFNTANTAFPTSYVYGEIYAFRVGGSSVGGDQFQVNSLSAKPIWKYMAGGTSAPIAAQDMTLTQDARLIYDGSFNGGAGAFILMNPWVPIYGDGSGGINVSGINTGGINAGGLIQTNYNGSGSGGEAIYATAGGIRSDAGGTALYLPNGNIVCQTIAVAGTDEGGAGSGVAIRCTSGGVESDHSGTAFYAPNGNVACQNVAAFGNVGAASLNVASTGYFGGDVTIHGGGAAALNVDNGGINAQLVTLYGGGSTVLNVPNGGITVAGTVSANLLAGPSGGTGNIKCFGGDWGNMAFAISSGSLVISPDNGSSGFIFGPGTGFSDARLKDNIHDTKVDALAAICATPVREFEWNEEGRKLMPHIDPMVPCGLVAQELEETIPFAVGISALAGDMRHIDHQNLVPYLLRAIQQLTERVVQLEHVVSV